MDEKFLLLDPAAANCLEKTVTATDLASFVQSGSLPVLGSPVLSCWMEELCRNMAAVGADEGVTSVGSAFSLQHLAPTPEGETVRIVAEEKGREKRMIFYHIEAYDKGGLIATAEHTRVSVLSERFMQKAAERVSEEA